LVIAYFLPDFPALLPAESAAFEQAVEVAVREAGSESLLVETFLQVDEVLLHILLLYSHFRRERIERREVG
jgi:hypothetical protein